MTLDQVLQSLVPSAVGRLESLYAVFEVAVENFHLTVFLWVVDGTGVVMDILVFQEGFKLSGDELWPVVRYESHRGSYSSQKRLQATG